VLNRFRLQFKRSTEDRFRSRIASCEASSSLVVNRGQGFPLVDVSGAERAAQGRKVVTAVTATAEHRISFGGQFSQCKAQREATKIWRVSRRQQAHI
jgi:hypothetical protein